jgi:hypothetical protein
MLYSVRKTLLSGLLCWGLAVSLAAEDDSALTEIQPLALDYAGIYSLRQADPNLTGDGISLAMVCRSLTYIDDKPLNDYRPDFAHNSLLDTPVTFHDSGDPAPAVSTHATAIASILFGRDPNAANDQLGNFNYQGVIPDAQAQVHQFDHFIINNVVHQKPPVGDVVSLSFGGTFEKWWTRGIESLAQHNDLIFVAAIGNGADAYDPPLYPAAGANVIAVGVVDSVSAADLAITLANFALASPAHSTCGPTGAGRCKPDIVAPGNCLVAEAGDPDGYSASGDFSSFATPVVSGIAGLLVQKARLDPALASAVTGRAKNCLIKAILLNSATKLPFWHKGLLTADDDHSAPLDHIQGAGMVNAFDAYEQLTAGRARPGKAPTAAWDKNVLRADTLAHRVYRINIPEPAGKNITVTAVWNNHYKNTFPFAAATDENADLRLELWAVDSNDHNADYLLDYSDSRIDNVEHIYRRADPNYAEYEIVLSINDIDDPNTTRTPQYYGLAWNVADADEPPGGEQDSILWYDLDSNGIVGRTDIAILLDNIEQADDEKENYLIGDLNTNGTIDINDVRILLDHTGLQADWRREQETTVENGPPRLTKASDPSAESSL